MKKGMFVLAGLLAFAPLLRAGNEVGFVERYALAADREKALTELTPGTEDYYYFHALHYENTGQKEKLAAILDQWAKRYPSSARRRVIDAREAMLAYPLDSKRTLRFLKQRYGLQFNDEREVRDRKPDLPTRLDPALVARDVYLKRALTNGDSLSGFSSLGMEQLLRDKTPISPAQRRALLSKLDRPDVPGLTETVIADLQTKESRGFGEFEIHKALLPEQLDAVAAKVPEVKEARAYVEARLRKLAPEADADAEFDAAVRDAWLDRLWAYAQTLPPAFNTLKAQVLFLRLDADRARGVYDKARFMEYLRLPRPMDYVNPQVLQKLADGRWRVDMGAGDFGGVIGCKGLGGDAELVRDYFLHFFGTETSWEPYRDYVREAWLKELFAEAKIVRGEGDAERWASLISPAAFQALKERVDIDFAPGNPQFFAPDGAVQLKLFVKNTPKLIVKVYEINTLSYYLQQKRPLNTDVALDGLVANAEETREFHEPPFRRTEAVFDFPAMTGRGVWMVEFIGGGKSSRALIRKGAWRVTQQPGAAGDWVSVLDEANAPVKDAVIWLDGRRFDADPKTGRVLLPFAETEATKPMVVTNAQQAFASLAELRQSAEAYQLDADFHVEREQLLSGRKAKLAVRAALWAGNPGEGARVPLELLKDAKLTLTSTTLDGISTSQEIAAPKLEVGTLFTHEFTVPDRLARLYVSLSGQVEMLTKGGEKKRLEASAAWDVNGIAKTERVSSGFLSRFGNEYVYELLGRNGEPLADQAVMFEFSRPGFTGTQPVSLRTDAKGRVALGDLAGISEVKARIPNGREGKWTIEESARTWPAVINAAEGETIQIPWSGPLTPESVSLLELRGDTYVADWSRLAAAKGAFLEIHGLIPGDYALRLRQPGGRDVGIHVFVTEGKPVGNWIAGRNRRLEWRDLPPLQVESAKAEGDSVRIQLRNWNRYTRVHVAASRFLPPVGLFAGLGGIPAGERECWTWGREPNLFLAGRQIGDEMRYILERRYAAKFPGNMLARPGLLLNPWEKRSTEDARVAALSRSEALRALNGGWAKGNGAPASSAKSCVMAPAPGRVSEDLDFLAAASPALYNLAPDEHGVVSVPRKALGDRQQVQVLAEDLDVAVWRTFALAEAPTAFADRRLERSLDAAQALTERKETTLLLKGEKLSVENPAGGEVEIYASLPRVAALYQTLQPGTPLAAFDWLMRWPALSEEEKRAKYSEFACNELAFFLSRKDPEFFKKVVQPHLRNQMVRTFFDDYLLDASLERYLEPSAIARLNTAEQALLAARLPKAAAAIARSLREWAEMLPPNLEAEDRFFETALRGMTLEGGNTYTGATVVASGVLQERVNKAWEMPVPRITARNRSGSAAMPAAAVDALVSDEKLKADKDSRQGDSAAKSGEKPKEEAELTKQLIDRRGADFDMKEVQAQREMAAARAYYRKLGETKEWAENRYYKLPLGQQGPALIPVNAFWRDYARWVAEGSKGPFLSPHFAEATRNFPEMMLALAVLDLPFEAPRPEGRAENGRWTLAAEGPLIVCHKAIQPAPAAPKDGEAALLVSEQFFRQSDRVREEGGERFDKFVSGEFLSGVVYGGNVVVSNPGSAPRKISLLLQIPQGALPVLGSKATESRRARLEPYSTQRFEYYFYFPEPSAKEKPFAHYPAAASQNGNAAGMAGASRFAVVRQPSGVDTASWDYVSQYGSEDDVFAFLETHNLARVNLSRVAWRCKAGVEFFRKLTAAVRARLGYDDAIWRYAVYHNDAPVLKEWLAHRADLDCGPWFASPLYNVDPVERGTYEHLEYSPLINPRAHRVGAEWRIGNPAFAAQYGALMEILAHKPSLQISDRDNLEVVYYLFLQDRVEEALARLHAVGEARKQAAMIRSSSPLPNEMQYDYLRCYAAFYEQNLAEARSIVKAYADYPVDRWRALFAEAASQLNVIEGAASSVPVPGGGANREAQQSALAAAEPSFEFKVENGAVALHWTNLRAVTVNYYRIDPEFAFSTAPFASQDASRFGIVKPAQSGQRTLAAGNEGTDTWQLPDAFARSSVLVEILGAGVRKTQAVHANTLKLTFAENYGRLDVRAAGDGKPVAAAYVKVYARLRNGTVRFFKDGYTDLRGKFDYASLNDSGAEARGNGAPSSEGAIQALRPGELGQVERLALLVMSDAHGSEVREVAPPQ